MIKNLLFDFDGVILDSNKIKSDGFRDIFSDFSDESVEKLVAYHEANGGISRYAKIHYFFRNILERNISDSEVNDYALEFTKIMRKKLIEPRFLITETIDFIKSNLGNYNIHIASGADTKELEFLCESLGIYEYFISIHGSPATKEESIRKIISYYGYRQNETILIGDSINDYNAAKFTGIFFVGFNNEELKSVGRYINCFSDLNKILEELCREK